MTVIKSYVVRIEEATPGSVTVVTDGVTIQGDGTAVDPVAVIANVFDSAGAAAAALSAANSYTDTGVGAKQNTLVSGTNIKTINGTSVLGAGNLVAGQKTFAAAFSDTTSAITTGTNKIKFPLPYDMTFSRIWIGLGTAQASGAILTVDVNVNGSTILSTKITIDNTETTSLAALVTEVISSATHLRGVIVSVDVDQSGDGTAVQGVIVFEG